MVSPTPLPDTTRVGSSRSPRLAATAIGLSLAGLVSIGVVDRLSAPPPAAPLPSPAAPTPGATAAPTAAAPEVPRVEARVVRGDEHMTTIELEYEAGSGYSGFLTFSSRWWPRPPAVRVVWPGQNGDERLLFQVPLSLGDPTRPGLPQDLAAGQLRLVRPLRGISHWEYRVQLEKRQPNGLNVAIEVTPALP